MGRKCKTQNYKTAIINYDATIEQAVSHMNCEAAMVVDEKNVLCGLITDGDIRRAFIAGAKLNTCVTEIMTKNPLMIVRGLKKREIRSIMVSNGIRHLPVVDSGGHPIGLELLKNINEEEMANAVIMAGGKGMRLRPLTIEMPKPLLKLRDGETILDNVLGTLKNSGVNDVIISVNYLGEKIVEHVDKNYGEDSVSINFVNEKKELGTAGSLRLLNPKPKNGFLVMNADLITSMDFRSLCNFHRKGQNHISVCVRRYTNTVPYGVVDIDGMTGSVEGIVEKPDYNHFVNAGIYMIEPGMIDLIPVKGPFDMVTLINRAIKAGYKIGAFPIIEYWRDVGVHSEMEEAKKDIQRLELIEKMHDSVSANVSFLHDYLTCEVL